MTRKLELLDSVGAMCRFTVEDAKMTRDVLQKFIEESSRELKPDQIRHGLRVYFGNDERTVIGSGGKFFVIDRDLHLQNGLDGPMSAADVARWYRRTPYSKA